MFSSIQTLLTILFFLLLCQDNLLAQENQLTLMSKQLNAKNHLVSEQLSRYSIVECDDLVNPKKIKTNDLLTLELGASKHDFKVYNNNLLIADDLRSDIQLLGGTSLSGGAVSLTISKNFIYGFYVEHGVKYYVQPLDYFDKKAKDNQFVIFKEEDILDDHKDHICGQGLKDKYAQEIATHTKSTGNGCKIMEIALANTYDMLQKYGSASAVLEHNLGVLNNVQTDYRSEFNTDIEFEMVAFYVATAASQDPFDANGTSSDANLLLPAFRNWASDGPGGIPGGTQGGFATAFDLAALWTARDITQGNSSIIGLAYTPGYFQILEDHTASAPRLQSLMTHETGHNLSALHDAFGEPTIMAPATASTNIWSTASVDAISNYISGFSQLQNCSTMGAPIANAFQSSIVICEGATVTFEDQTKYGECSNWTFENANIASSTEAKPTVSFNTAGYNLISLTATNTQGADNYMTYVNVQAEPDIDCSPASQASTGGISSISLENLTMSSGLGNIDGSYSNHICAGTASLTAGATHDLIITLTGVTYINFYYDFDGDGNFDGQNESDTGYFLNNDGNYLIPLSMPTDVESNTLIRMRIITSNNQISGPCFNPSVGEVEDYGILFYEEEVLGCTDFFSSNYNPAATIDDGSCSNNGEPVWYLDNDGDGYGHPILSQTSPTQPSGYVDNNDDCNDFNPNINPASPEVCDNLDNNCNQSIDEGLTLNTYYLDQDGDGYGDINAPISNCSQPAGYSSNGEDCDDNDPSTFPNRQESCDGVDNNCNGLIDENLAIITYYQDLDRDGYGNAAISQTSCGLIQDWVREAGDCDDNNPNINPNAPEICDGIDNNCDQIVDDSNEQVFYRDSDDDGYGDPAITLIACIQPNGYVANGADCNDNNANINPGAEEACDGADNNCNNQIDEGITQNIYYRDADNDGYGNENLTITGCTQANGYVILAGDCDDTNAEIHPQATEQCNNLDNNCNGIIDDGVNEQNYYQDLDGDGYGNNNAVLTACSEPTGYVLLGGDCNDNNPEINPGAAEICDNIDNNCNNDIDDGLTHQTYYQDIDEDGYGNSAEIIIACSQPQGYVMQAGDCNDNNTDINPAAIEACDDIDNNCNGSIDENVDATQFYRDQDGDGYGNINFIIESCTAPDGYSSIPGDCNDNDPSINPDSDEACDNIDNNCNGSIDEGVDATQFYRDQDGDGYGNIDFIIESCTAPDGYSPIPGDCNDNDPSINPDSDEACDNIDNNCNGSVDENLQTNQYYLDQDGDGYGNIDIVIVACSVPVGYTSLAGDCNDGDATIHPAAIESCDGLDNNCNGTADDNVQTTIYYADKDEDGFGDNSQTIEACQKPDGYVETPGDCNDDDAAINPDSEELCDNIDNNCNNQVDEANCIEINSLIWNDTNANGSFDNGESGIPSILVTLIDEEISEEIAQTVTNEIGQYNFENLAPSTYSIIIDKEMIEEFVISYNPYQYTEETTYLKSQPMVIDAQSVFNIPTVSYYKGGEVTGRVIQEENQTPIYTNVQLISQNNPLAVFRETSTDSMGTYVFDKIPVGNYFVQYLAPVGFDFVTDDNMPMPNSVQFSYLDDTMNQVIGQTQAFSIMPETEISNINGVLTNVNNILSLELYTNLKANWNENASVTDLVWELAGQYDISKLIIERSTNVNKDYVAIGESDNPKQGIHHYSDSTCYDEGINYYRLKLLSPNGEITYSNIVSVNVTFKEAKLVLYPNPVTDKLFIESSTLHGTVQVSLMASDGKIVYKSLLEADSDGRLQIATLDLVPGLYYLRLTNGNRIYNRQIIKLN